jgi:hypothetical protein
VPKCGVLGGQNFHAVILNELDDRWVFVQFCRHFAELLFCSDKIDPIIGIKDAWLPIQEDKTSENEKEIIQ